MSAFDIALKDAVDYVAAHGMDDSPQLRMFIQLLRQAGNLSFMSDDQMQSQMMSALTTCFNKAISKNQLNKVFSGKVSTMTIEKIKPELRTELDRRIMANISLIKLNREQAIDKTMQRFGGWMTSVPVGGSRAIDKKVVIRDIKKSAQQLRYEVRRRNIDQGQKLISSINSVIAIQTNALAAVWHSRWRRPNYDYREHHKELDGKVFALRGNWAIEKGFMKRGNYSDEIKQPGEEIYCSCSFSYIYTLGEVPAELLTAKGRESLNADGQ